MSTATPSGRSASSTDAQNDIHQDPPEGAGNREEQLLRNDAETGSAVVQSEITLVGAPDGIVHPDEEEGLSRSHFPGEASTLGLRKFRDHLPMPSVIRAWERPRGIPVSVSAEIAKVRHHADLPLVDAWTYEGKMPGPTIEVQSHRLVLIDWRNALTEDGRHSHGHQDHLEDEPAGLPYDVVRVPPHPSGIGETIRIAGQPGGMAQEDHGHGHLHPQPENAYPRLAGTDGIRAATSVHLHGALTDGHNDGWAHNVMLPGHTARCTYPNRQEACTMWYHDHAMAVTRFSVYAGLAGFYLIRDANEERLRLPAGAFELQLMVADRNLESEPGSPEDFRPTGRFLYKQAGIGADDTATEIPVTGPFNSVNGKIWPTHRVEARWHRIRLLNASNSRIYRFALYDTTDEAVPLDTNLASNPAGGFGADPTAFGMDRKSQALVVIGTEGGFLPEPVIAPNGVVELGPGERTDVLVDFAALRGRTVELRNENATNLNPRLGQPDATVMQFTVDKRQRKDPFKLPKKLNPAYYRWRLDSDGAPVVGPDPVKDKIEDVKHVWIGVIPPGTRGNVHPQMWELEDVSHLAPEEIGDTEVIRLSREGGDPLILRAGPKLFDDAVRILLAEKDWAMWHVVHLGGPAHPIHIHMTTFQMIERRSWGIAGGNVPGFDPVTGSTAQPLPLPGLVPIDAITGGTKETWVVRPGEIVTVLGHFAGANGSFMYHCHILDHEDHTMMRPFVVLPASIMAFHGGHGGDHH
ncbi:copper oxidase [Kocuria coralli]|uniref:Copper oxidase n=1 Tax=Kocuria coralli TaxID=1461025 RepID=A0A5J5KXP2_9MICC|nr:multicopper oxidase domain-containing protein [Kocuria coralli]KAA9393511.1 copper oxidase [Kocuria coralli]